MFCSNCGSSLRESARFCPICGNTLTDATGDTNVTPSPDARSNLGVATQSSNITPAPDSRSNQGVTNQSSKGRSRVFIAAGCAVVVLVLAGLSFAFGLIPSPFSAMSDPSKIMVGQWSMSITMGSTGSQMTPARYVADVSSDGTLDISSSTIGVDGSQQITMNWEYNGVTNGRRVYQLTYQGRTMDIQTPESFDGKNPVGTWILTGSYSSEVPTMTFDSNGTFSLVVSGQSARGTWTRGGGDRGDSISLKFDEDTYYDMTVVIEHVAP